MEKQYCYKYPRPAVTADCVVFGFDGADLSVLLIERKHEPYQGCWAFPGGFMNMDETAEECALRELREETGIIPALAEQIRTFTEVDRDPRGRIITVAFYALVKSSSVEPEAGDDASKVSWFSINDLPPLAFDHQQILAAAIEKLKERLRQAAADRGLLEPSFSVPELQRLYEAVGNVK